LLFVLQGVFGFAEFEVSGRTGFKAGLFFFNITGGNSRLMELFNDKCVEDSESLSN